MSAIFKREFKSYFTSPVGYIFFAVALFFAGQSFCTVYSAGYTEISYVFSEMFSVSFLLVPVLTMRLISEDRRQKVDQALFTSPVSVSSIVLGKFFATFCIYALSFSITFVFQFILALYASLDWTVFLSNLVGVLLFGSALISIGLFISALTESQLVSAIGSFAVSILLLSMDNYTKDNLLGKIISYISFSSKYNEFLMGVLNYANVIFFLSITALFVFLTVRALEKKRWA